MTFYIGVDAGGTQCRASLYNNDGQLIGTGCAGPANVFSDFVLAMQQIDIAIDDAIMHAEIAIDKSQLVVGAGCAGGQTEQAQAQLTCFSHPFQHLFMTSDLHASCVAANGGEDCIVLITGTGSSIAHFHANKVTQYGGHGFVHGDEASGAWLGLTAVQMLLKSYDKLIDDEVFFTAISNAIGCDYNREAVKTKRNVDYILNQFKAKNAADYALLAPVIINLQIGGNKTASMIVRNGANYLYDILDANHLKNAAPIFMTGGLANNYQSLLEQKLGQAVNIMQRPAQEGAMLYAKAQMDALPALMSNK